MFENERPHIEIREVRGNTYGCFVVDKLGRGFGTTVGNALRRVLLSALPGAAVVSVKIDGVLHEFSHLPGVREDITEIVLNIKSLFLKVHGDDDEPKRIEVSASGPGPVFAGDIVLPSDVEVLNPGHTIANLDGEGAKLGIEMTVRKGRGYVSADKNKSHDHAIGVIPVDSIYTPVRKVNFSVEPTRVGSNTDFDKLILEVWTNGTITPKDAVCMASRILSEHFALFVDLNDMDTGAVSFEPNEEGHREKLLEMTIEELDLSVRSYNCLKRASINTVEDLASRSEEDMMKVRNLGRKSLEEVLKKMADLGLRLQPSEE